MPKLLAIEEELFTAIERSHLSLSHVAKKSGVGRATIRYWKDGRSIPTLHNFIAILNFLGYDLKIVPRSKPY